MGAEAREIGQLADALARASRVANVTVNNVMDEVAEQIKDRMVALAPKRTGRLAGSIQVLKTNNSWTIGPKGVNYAVYQEYGTASRGEFGGTSYKIRPRDSSGMLHFKIDGQWISTKEVTHPGIPPHPYIRPAADQVIRELQQGLQNSVNDLIKEKK